MKKIDEKMKKNFEESDGTLKFMEILFMVLMWIGIIAGIIGSIFLFDFGYVVVGFLIIIASVLLSILGYKIAMFIVWIAYDIKVIRTACTNSEPTYNLLSFQNQATVESTQEDDKIAEEVNNRSNNTSLDG